MPAKDKFHASVSIALQKDGWIITHDPLHLKVDDIEFYIDLGAERLLAAEKGGQKIAVEIKSFLGTSEVTEFHLALGQILNYKLALSKTEPDRPLYLAISQDTYEEFFSRQFVQESLQFYAVKLLIFDYYRQEVVLWKE
ncbi:XisH family protein [Roseofilum capinflatum]|uniref:XisH family protein n=1 Tax=Roseofilum capinflatum BLCC-M114 TaxID=3022440 RepID=A0ABT7B3Q3_9CYAN|nr:XisH family protein [Roseofilum capinflatum]MDJ1173741.1 XisH family protein [Roseofilum capinflatum BLCC-M114]